MKIHYNDAFAAALVPLPPTQKNGIGLQSFQVCFLYSVTVVVTCKYVSK